MEKNNIKVLIVDDSRVFRSMIEQALQGEKNIEVAGSVRNGVKAIEFIKSNPVDIVTLDLEMPDMDGLQTLEQIRAINASGRSDNEIGVIMVSAYTQKGADITIKALEAGAFDFITKPDSKNYEDNIVSLQRQLISKLRSFGTRRLRADTVLTPEVSDTNIVRTSARRTPASIKAVLIGVSTGGPRALLNILPDLSAKIHLPVFIVQHMPPTFTRSLAGSLDAKCRHTVIESDGNNIVQRDYIYIAPGGKHMQLKNSHNNGTITVINEDPPENGCRPSVDVLFRSAPDVYAGNVVAVILTGMGVDGTEGLRPLKERGAYVIAQDKESSVVWGMPGSAVNAGLVDKVLPLGKIPDWIENVVYNKSGTT